MVWLITVLEVQFFSSSPNRVLQVLCQNRPVVGASHDSLYLDYSPSPSRREAASLHDAASTLFHFGNGCSLGDKMSYFCTYISELCPPNSFFFFFVRKGFHLHTLPHSPDTWRKREWSVFGRYSSTLNVAVCLLAKIQISLFLVFSSILEGRPVLGNVTPVQYFFYFFCWWWLSQCSMVHLIFWKFICNPFLFNTFPQ